MAREEPQNLLSFKPVVLFVETSGWRRSRKVAYKNHFFARAKDVFWELMQEFSKNHNV